MHNGLVIVTPDDQALWDNQPRVLALDLKAKFVMRTVF